MFYVRWYIELMGSINAREVIISKLYFSHPEVLRGKLKAEKIFLHRVLVCFEKENDVSC